jgi:hypothetical protein
MDGKMNDSEMYLHLLRLVKAYHLASLSRNKQLAYEISIDMAEVAQNLSDIACDIANDRN